VYKQLGVGELKPTKVMIQLADRSVKVPRGELEDVLIKVNEFVFPVDFIVLDTAPVSNLKRQTPMILGRPFLATSNAMINCRTGSMKLTFGNMTIDLNIFNQGKQPSDPEDEYVGVNEIQGSRSFEERLDEELSLFEMRSNEEDDEPDLEERERRFMEEFRLFEEKEQRRHQSQLSSEISSELELAQNPIEEEECLSHDTQKSSEVKIVCSSYEGDNVENSEWEDPYLELVGEGFNPLFQPIEKEPVRFDLWPNSLDNMSTLDMTDTHIYNDPFYNDTGHFEQGEWIFDYECKFFENSESYSDHIGIDEGNEFRSTINLEMTESAVEIEELMEEQLGLDDKTESRTTGRVRWKKKKNARMRRSIPSSGWREVERIFLKNFNVEINSIKRTHFQSGKRARGRNRPSLI
jgi:hypothetical protein